MGKLTLYFHRGISKITCRRYPNITKSSFVDHRVIIYNNKNLIMEENTNIDGNATIMNTRAKFIMKKNSGAAIGLTVITGGHMSIIGMHFKQVTNKVKDRYDVNHKYDNNITVGEDCWIASNVSLLSGVSVGRGCIIGSGSVIRTNVPPYAITFGNPAKIVGFRFTPEEIVEHEKVLYPEDDRISLEVLEKNYDKYFLKRIKEIQEFTRI